MHNWFPAEWSDPIHLKQLSVILPLVLFHSKGKIQALVDSGPHGRAPLSKRCVRNCLVCPYIDFQTMRQEGLGIKGFLSSINEQCSKIFLISLINSPLPRFLVLVKPRKRSKPIQPLGAGKKVGSLLGPFLDLLIGGKEILKREYEVPFYV